MFETIDSTMAHLHRTGPEALALLAIGAVWLVLWLGACAAFDAVGRTARRWREDWLDEGNRRP